MIGKFNNMLTKGLAHVDQSFAKLDNFVSGKPIAKTNKFKFSEFTDAWA